MVEIAIFKVPKRAIDSSVGIWDFQASELYVISEVQAWQHHEIEPGVYGNTNYIETKIVMDVNDIDVCDEYFILEYYAIEIGPCDIIIAISVNVVFLDFRIQTTSPKTI